MACFGSNFNWNHLLYTLGEVLEVKECEDFRILLYMALRHFLLKIGFLDLNENRMNDLISESNGDMIRWAFNTGRYNVRMLAIEYFVNHKVVDASALLQTAVDDKTEIVSQAAMLGIEQFKPTQTQIEQIAAKRQYWIDENEYRKGRRNRVHRKTSPLTESKERGSKKTLDNMRSMLKKPMGSGKWF